MGEWNENKRTGLEKEVKKDKQRILKEKDIMELQLNALEVVMRAEKGYGNMNVAPFLPSCH
jgi:hypothetical protein